MAYKNDRKNVIIMERLLRGMSILLMKLLNEYLEK